MKHYSAFALVIIAAINLALLALLIVLPRYLPTAFTPWGGGPGYWFIVALGPCLWMIASSTSLLFLTYSRIFYPWRFLLCTAWVAAAMWLCDHGLEPRLTYLNWSIVCMTVGFWAWHAVLLLARWYFGTEIDVASAPAAKRRSIFTFAVLRDALPIIMLPVLGGIFLYQWRGPWSPDFTNNLSGAILGGGLQAMLGLPLLLPLLSRRNTWAWCGFTLFAVLTSWLFLSAASMAPTPTATHWSQVIGTILGVAPLLINAILLRLLGFRWTETEPWPAQQNAILLPAPSLFD